MNFPVRMTMLATLVGALWATVVSAAELNGLLALGTISKDEDGGDHAVMQETYNIYEGFALSWIKLDGTLGNRSSLSLDLKDINRDSRQGRLTYLLGGLGRVSMRYDEYRQIYDANGSVTSLRKDGHLGVHAAPTPWLRLNGAYDVLSREGDRLTYPAATRSGGWLDDRYDYTLQRGSLEAEVQKDGRGLACGIEGTDLDDDSQSRLDRNGRVFSVRAYGSDPFLPGLISHYARAVFGKQEISNTDLDYTISSFNYTGTVRPLRRLQFRYGLLLSRVKDESTQLQTDRVRNEADLTYAHRYGRLFGGYSYVTNDDDLRLTSGGGWRVGGSFADGLRLKARISYAESERDADEDLTLLKDIENSRFRASLKGRPREHLNLGASYLDRRREFTVLGVKATGQTVNTFGRIEQPGIGAFSVDFSYTKDKYDDRVGGFRADSRIVAAQVDLTAVKDLQLSATLAYLNIGLDLDIEKSILGFRGQYDLLEDYFVEVKYNIYNYDDYILLDRYYTANVVWVNVGYRLSID
jgi:hypothetical protein